MRIIFKKCIDKCYTLLYSVYCYKVFIAQYNSWKVTWLVKGLGDYRMKIIVNNSSMIPIYSQIIQQIKAQIADGTLKENDALPSVRALSKDLNISALTVKKAYDELEANGFVITVHGKGTYVNGNNSEYIRESRLKEIEDDLRKAVEIANMYGITREELFEMFDMLTEE